MTTTDKIHQTLRDSAGMRWLVLLLLAFAMFCSYIFYGHTFTYQRPDAIYPWLGFDSIRYDAGF